MSLPAEEIFKAYDIRGVYPTELDETTAEHIGRAYASLLREENPDRELTVVVGKDMRLSSPSLAAKLIEGLRMGGLHVVEVGLVTTPTFYFAVAFLEFDGGIQVSASHNPKEYNGFKMVRRRSQPIGRDTGMAEIKRRVMEQDFVPSDRPGTVSLHQGIVEEEVREQTKDIDLSSIKPFKIVVDAANAMGALDVEAMFKGLPVELIKLNFELDGNFPVHQPDPLDEKNLEIVQKAVVEHQADLGICPDGDGDRYFFVAEDGQIIRQEILRGIMAQIALKEHPGATVCYDIRPGRITKDMIEAANGKAVVTQVGHSLIKKTMLDVDAVFGGESSGHYFYKFTYGTFEAPIPFVLKFLHFLSQQDRPVSQVIKPYQKYFHSGEINSKVVSVPEALTRIQQAYSDASISLLDGVTVEYADWWFNVRGSNTEPLIRLNLEATTAEQMAKKRDEVLAVIRAGA